MLWENKAVKLPLKTQESNEPEANATIPLIDNPSAVFAPFHIALAEAGKTLPSTWWSKGNTNGEKRDPETGPETARPMRIRTGFPEALRISIWGLNDG